MNRNDDWRNPYNTLQKLESLGAKGPDEDLEVSLYGLGFVWVKDGSEHTFVYGLEADKYGILVKFDHCTFDRKKFDFFKSYRYLNWDKFFAHYKTNFDEWTRKPFALRMYDVYLYFGAANTFFAKLRRWQDGFKVTL